MSDLNLYQQPLKGHKEQNFQDKNKEEKINIEKNEKNNNNNNNNNINLEPIQNVKFPISFIPLRETDILDPKLQAKWKKQFQKFQINPDQQTFESPPGLSPEDRRFLHSLAEQANLKSESRGESKARTVFIWKEPRSSQEKISSSIRKKWRDDFGLKVSMVCDDDFDYFLELYDHTFQTKQKFEYLKEALNWCLTESRFGIYYDNLKQNVKDHICSKNGFEKFINDPLQEYLNDPCMSLFKDSDSNVYLPENDQKKFISIDIRSSNFNSIRFYDPDLLDQKSNWKDFLSQFTKLNYFLENKLFRQKIFWLLEPSKIK